jgi:hypothetical protein
MRTRESEWGFGECVQQVECEGGADPARVPANPPIPPIRPSLPRIPPPTSVTLIPFLCGCGNCGGSVVLHTLPRKDVYEQTACLCAPNENLVPNTNPHGTIHTQKSFDATT